MRQNAVEQLSVWSSQTSWRMQTALMMLTVKNGSQQKRNTATQADRHAHSIAQCTSDSTCGSVTLWLARLEFELGDPGSIPAPLFHWVATLGKLFTHIASPVYQLQETGNKGNFRRLSAYGD